MQRLPEDAPDLTAEWLAGALGSDVTAVVALARSSSTNLHLRLALTGEGVPASIFVKLPPLDPAHRASIGASGMGVREARFYADLAPECDLRVPRAFHADHAQDGTFVLVLEDLAARGCAFSDGTWGIRTEAAAEALADLARFHARFEDPGFRTKVAPWTETARRSPTGEFVTRTLRWVLDEHRSILSDDYVAVGELFIEHHRRIDELWEQGPQTFIHGDPHIGNVFLDRGRVGFHDWGLCRVSTPMRDVSYFLTMAVEPADRRRDQVDLLRHYLEVRRSCGVPAIPFDEAWRAHRLHAGYTVVATFLGMAPQYDNEDSRPLAVALRERSMDALDDLGTLDALIQELA